MALLCVIPEGNTRSASLFRQFTRSSTLVDVVQPNQIDKYYPRVWLPRQQRSDSSDALTAYVFVIGYVHAMIRARTRTCSPVTFLTLQPAYVEIEEKSFSAPPGWLGSGAS
jgi:hypothetical protein